MDYVNSIEPLNELIIVNDGSSKLNVSEAENFFSNYPNIHFYSYPVNKGKGHALRYGINEAKGDLIIYTDIDFPYTENSFRNIFSSLKAGADVAIGVRSTDYYLHLPKARVYVSKFTRVLIRTFLSIPVDDTQCGLKGFNEKGKAVFLKTSIERYLFDMEFIFLSARGKLKIEPVVVELREGIQLSVLQSKILFQEGRNFIKILIKNVF